MRIRLNALPYFNHMLLVRLNDDKVIEFEKNDNYTSLLNNQREVVGYQIENFDSTLAGEIIVTKEILDKINYFLNSNLEHDDYSYLVVGKVIKLEEHPHSNHLKVCQVDIGKEVIQIVCGASNVKEGLIGVVALENAIIKGEIIRESVLLKVPTKGMLCSAYELGLISEMKKGLLELGDSYEIGSEFKIERKV